MRHTGDGKGLRLKIFKRLVALQLILAGTLLAQGVDMEVVPTTEAQKMLKALIPHGKKFVAFTLTPEEELEARRSELRNGLTDRQRLFLFGKLSGLNDKDARAMLWANPSARAV